MITPHELYPSLGAALAVPALFFKREDLHPYGSHKGRSIPLMIDHYRAQGAKDFVISSSGNAALAAALHIALLNSEKKENIKLTIFIGQHIDSKKGSFLSEIKDPNIQVLQVDRPLQEMTKLVQKGSTPLRQSTDDIALIGYKDLADELLTIPALEAVFIAASSGTTAQALATTLIPEGVQVHIAQTPSCHPIFDYWNKQYGNGGDHENANDHTDSADTATELSKEIPEEKDGGGKGDQKSIAGAIVDRIGHRKDAVAAGVHESNGACWIISNDEIVQAQEIVLKTTGLAISTNSALSVAALMKALDEGAVFEGAVACIICGH